MCSEIEAGLFLMIAVCQSRNRITSRDSDKTSCWLPPSITFFIVTNELPQTKMILTDTPVNTEKQTMQSQVVAIDVGNTRVKFGLFRLATGKAPEVIDVSACVRQSVEKIVDALQRWLTDRNEPTPQCFMLAGSDPDVRDEILSQWPPEYNPPQVIARYSQIPVLTDVDYPDRVGIDRLLTTFAAWELAERQRSVIVVDSGTATTVDLMTSDGTFRGGSILPGLRLSAHALHDYTARLPMLDTDRELQELPQVPGRNTEAAMLAGLYIGQLGAVRELVTRLTTAAAVQFGQPQPPLLFVCGGGGRQLVAHLPGATFADSLALHGLAMLQKRD
jgi:type III pantothenate kinase